MSQIRVLHFADLHLGIENYGRLDPTTGLSTRLMDFLHAFDALVDHAIQTEVDLVIFAGDAFKNRTPSPTHEREFAQRIRRLAEHMPVFLLVGNHDLPNAMGRAHTLEIYETLAIPNVYVARRPELFRIPTRQGDVQVLSIPWMTRSAILRREDMRGKSWPEIQMLMLERLHSLVTELLDGADKTLPLIVTAHATVQGATYGSERSVMLGQDLVLPPHLFRHPKITYTALGHIHKHQMVIADPPAVYSGSVERIDFGEEKEDKGFIDLTLQRQRNGHWRADWQFYPLQTRPFITIHVNAPGKQATETVLDAIRNRNIYDAVIRLFIHTDAVGEVHLDDRRIREALADAFHIAALYRDVERPLRLRLNTPRGVESLSPLDLLEQYLKSINIDPKRARVLIRHAQQLLTAEE